MAERRAEKALATIYKEVGYSKPATSPEAVVAAVKLWRSDMNNECKQLMLALNAAKAEVAANSEPMH